MWFKNKKKIAIIFIFLISIFVITIVKMNPKVKLNENVTLEAGVEIPSVSVFLLEEKVAGEYVTDVSTIDTSTLGTHQIDIKIGRKTYSTKLEIKDTVPPTGEAVDHEIWVGEVLEASEFVTNIIDATKVTVTFKEEPNFMIPGNHQVAVILKDEGLNETQIMASLSITKDTEPPVITGVKDQSISVGGKISYRNNIEVTDNRDENVELIIDSSGVNVKQVGNYQVVYTATDSSGNTATKTANIYVKEKPLEKVTQEDINKLADQVLARIIKANMTDKEKMWAIYTWTRSHISYTGKSDKSDWLKGAYQGFTKASGDCFNYYATARALLTRAGYEVMTVQRIPGTPTRHYWLLVKYKGQWYHYDPSPNARNYPYTCFLKTDKEVEAYTKKVMERVPEYYTYDKSKYPPRATVPLK